MQFSARPAAAATAVLLLLLTGCAASPPPRLPAGFPRAVPVLPGHVLAVKHADGEWRVWVRSAAPLSGYRRARALLLKAGFRETANEETAGGSDGQYCRSRYCTGLTGYDDPEYGASVVYEVFATTGMSANG